MKKHIPSALLILLLSVFMITASPTVQGQQEEVRFVSSPDFFNFDVPNPMPEWEDAVNWYLNLIKKKEDPDLFLVAGDLVDGRWHNHAKTVEHMGLIYYEGWKRRMKRHDLTYVPAIGDHEMGDNPWGDKKAQLAPTFKEVFRRHFDLPGKHIPQDNLVSYYYGLGNVLFITVDQFEFRNNDVHTTVSGKHLQWLKQVLKKQGPKADFIVVQGHMPIVGNPKASSSSKLMLDGGRDSDFWQLMKKAGVDLYLCGEFHALTTNKTDGIWQVVHGTSWGRKGHKQSYLVGKSSPNRLDIAIRKFPLIAKGEKIWNLNKGTGGPREIMRIPESVRKNGPETVGTITIRKQGDQETQVNASGVFDK